MKSLVLTLLLIPALSFAAETKTEETRKPASLRNELMHSYLHTAEILSKARNTDQVCDTGAFQSAIIDAIRKATNSGDFSPSMITVEMKKALVGTLALQEFLGTLDPYKASVSQYQKALENAYFEAPGMGVYGPPSWMTLAPGGILKVTTRNVLDQEPWVKDTESKGTWGVQLKKENYSDVVRVWFKVNGKTTTYRLERSFESMMDNGWVLKVKKGKANQEEHLKIKFYNGSNSECEA